MSNKRLRASNKINFQKLGDELKQPGVSHHSFKHAVGVVLADDSDLNIRYIAEKPQLLEPFVDAISTVENTGLLFELLSLLFNIWTRCQKYVDPNNLFPIKRFRDHLIRLFTNSELRANKTIRISILKCLSEVLAHNKAKSWSDCNLPLSMVRELVETYGNVSNFEGEKGGDIVLDQLHVILLKFASVALVNICSDSSYLELRTRMTREYGEKIVFLANAAIAYNLSDVARDCCLIWHNLTCGNDLIHTVHLMRTSVVLDATIAILDKFKGRAEGNTLTRSAALLFISNVSALSTIGKNRLASAKELLVIVYEILSQEYVEADSLPVLACCKTLARLTCLDECKSDLHNSLEMTMKAEGNLLLMMVLIRWKNYENIVGYVLEICDNISINKSCLFRKNILDSYKPTLEKIICRFGLNDYKIGYAARRLLVEIECGDSTTQIVQIENTQSA